MHVHQQGRVNERKVCNQVFAKKEPALEDAYDRDSAIMKVVVNTQVSL